MKVTKEKAEELIPLFLEAADAQLAWWRTLREIENAIGDGDIKGLDDRDFTAHRFDSAADVQYFLEPSEVDGEELDEEEEKVQDVLTRTESLGSGLYRLHCAGHGYVDVSATWAGTADDRAWTVNVQDTNIVDVGVRDRAVAEFRAEEGMGQ